MTPEQRTHVDIDRRLHRAGWYLCDFAGADIHATRRVAIREFPLVAGHDSADYLLYVDGKGAGVIEMKKASVPLIVTAGLQDAPPARAASVRSTQPTCKESRPTPRRRSLYLPAAILSRH